MLARLLGFLARRLDGAGRALLNATAAYSAPTMHVTEIIVQDEPAAWPQERDRTLTISRALAGRCELGLGLLELAQDRDMDQDEAARTGADPDALAVPHLPASVPSHGVRVLDRWAQQHERAGGYDAAWLPAFLVAHARDLTAAACAADFLGCRGFLELAMGVALLRVALRGGEALQPGCVVPPLTSLGESDFLKLHCLQQQQRGAAGPGEPPPPPGAVPQGATEGAAAAAGTPSAGSEAEEGSVGSGWDEQYEAPSPESPPRATQPAEGEGAAEGAVPPPPALPLLAVAPERLEALVAGLLAGSLLAFTGAQAEDVRLGLYRLGFRPTVAHDKRGEATVSNGKAAYMRLQLGATKGGWRAACCYRVAAIVVEVEAHDQGWSSYREDHNTLRNSWTWGELVLAGPHGQPVRPGDPGRLYTNLHAVERWQQHRLVLGPHSDIVQDLGALAAAAAAAVSAGGEEGAADGARVSGPPPEPQLVLFVCAAFPGWQHHVRRAQVAVELCPHSYVEA